MDDFVVTREPGRRGRASYRAAGKTGSPVLDASGLDTG
jgi:DNA integrity scanning protein DisA with diadenylate cyclase activity